MKKIDNTTYRYAIIIDNYVYKDYADLEQLQRGIERFHQRRYKPVPFRLAKLEVKTKEIERIKF